MGPVANLAFSVFCPKAVAGIGELPSTLEDRSIVVEMNRRGADDRSVDDVKYGDIFEDLTPLRRKLLRWSGDHREALTGAGPEEPEALNARERDHWRLLFAIADLCSPSWGERIRAAAVTLSSRRRQPDVGTLLLEDIRRIIMDLNGWKQIPSSELAYTLAGIEDRPWYEWGGPKGFNPHQLAILLHPYNIKPKALYRQGQSDVVRGYLFTDFLEAFDRYLPKLPVLQRSALPEHPDAVKINLSFTKS